MVIVINKGYPKKSLFKSRISYFRLCQNGRDNITRVLTENTEVLISSMTQKKNVREKTCQILREVLFCYEREEGMLEGI